MTNSAETNSFNPEMEEYLGDLLSKSAVALSNSVKGSNLHLTINGVERVIDLRIDDIKLITICALLIPNVLNYLVNVIPQLIYPYVVAYLQNLSELRDDDPVVINELYDYIIENYGYFFNSSKAED